MLRYKLLLFLFLSCIATARCEAQSHTIEGSWIGRLNTTTGRAVALEFTVRAIKDGRFTGSWSSPDQLPYPGEISNIEFNRDTFSFDLSVLHASYFGVMSRNGFTIDGAYTQGVSIPVTLHRARTFLALLSNSTVSSFLTSERIALKLAEDSGKLVGTLEEIDHGESEYSIDLATNEGDSLKFEVPELDRVFSGAYSNHQSGIKGVWKSPEANTEIAFQQIPVAPKLIRAQEPKPPYPYTEDTVSYENPHAHIRLAGTLTRPKGKGPFPAVFLITGSGPQDRDEELMGHRPFKVIADYLTRHGIAVLRTDDRGTGKSGGNFGSADTRDFASDARAAIQYLKSRPEINAKKIGLIGHSEGGMIAPMVAAHDTQFYSDPSDVNFILLLAGPGIPITQLMREQRRMLSEDTPSLLQTNLDRASTFDSIIAADELYPTGKLPHIVDSLWKVAYFSEGGDSAELHSAPVMQKKMTQMGTFLSPWYRYFIAYDPTQVFKNVHCPVLAFNGALDHQVICQPDLDGIASALKAGGNKDVTVHSMPGLNHLFQHAKTGLVNEYAEIPETFSPEVLEIMTQWITKETQK
jgi:pimeloyl-ACP methyl ester carboxylesterase